MRKLFYGFLLGSCFIAGCNANQLANIKAENNYKWQEYMNEMEYEQLKEGLSYTQVVKIAGGEGELVKKGIYVWPDELLLTKAYEITFENDKLTKKEIIELRGASKRDLIEEKEPAKRERK